MTVSTIVGIVLPIDKERDTMKQIKEVIKKHFEGLNLDIRESGNGRYIDQKCAPDILCSVAEVILEYVSSGHNTFTVREVMESEQANEVMVNQFQKPPINHPGAASEYDKVFSQPIKLLEYAKILTTVDSVGRAVKYSISQDGILTYIATGERKALEFLTTYLNKVMAESELLYLFQQFFGNPSKSKFQDLKDGYCDFIIDNTPINGLTESRRIFSKVINPLAYYNQSYGTKAGRMSPTPIHYQDLFYNRVNFRDLDKPKGMPRTEFLDNIPEDTAVEAYQINKAVRLIRRYHNEESEINRFKVIPATHVHHIFPKHEFPELSDTFENLILLTSGQHLSYAHPNGNTQRVSKPYQLVALLSKLDSIEKSIFSEKDEFYSLKEYIRVVNVGLDKEILVEGMGVEELRHALSMEYCN